MKTCNKLVRDNVATMLENKGFDDVEYEILKGKKLRTELYSLFLQEFKDSLKSTNTQQTILHYADMLEVLRTLIVYAKMDVRQIGESDDQAFNWYKNSGANKRKLAIARVDLLQKYDELLKIRTEAIKDQLCELLASFKAMLEVSDTTFASVEQTRRAMYKNLGGFTKGIYLIGASRI